MFFSSFRVEKPMRFAGQVKRSAGYRCAHTKLAMPAMRAKKKPAGVDHPTGFLFGLKDGPPGTRGPGSSTRTTPRSRRTTPRRQRMRRKEDVLVRGSCPDLQKGAGEKQKTRWLEAYRVLWNTEAEPPGVKGSRKAVLRIRRAARRPRLRGSSVLVRWSGTASWCSGAVGCSPRCYG